MAAHAEGGEGQRYFASRFRNWSWCEVTGKRRAHPGLRHDAAARVQTPKSVHAIESTSTVNQPLR